MLPTYTYQILLSCIMIAAATANSLSGGLLQYSFIVCIWNQQWIFFTLCYWYHFSLWVVQTMQFGISSMIQISATISTYFVLQKYNDRIPLSSLARKVLQSYFGLYFSQKKQSLVSVDLPTDCNVGLSYKLLVLEYVFNSSYYPILFLFYCFLIVDLPW